jgi:hypothetical protein
MLIVSLNYQFDIGDAISTRLGANWDKAEYIAV